LLETALNSASQRVDPVSRFERREAQVTRILDAARTCFRRSGFHGASMGEICAAAAMSPGALYRYFPSKESLVEALCASDREEDARILMRVTEAEDVVEGLVVAIKAHVEQVHSSGMAPLFSEMFAEALRNEAIAATMMRSMCEARLLLASAVESAYARKEIDPVMPLTKMIDVMMAMGHGLISHDLPRMGISADDMEPALRAMIVAMLRPVAKPGAKVSPPPVQS
jgi:TetR/AcrR family transcriptional regulator, repressor for uid operon